MARGKYSEAVLREIRSDLQAVFLGNERGRRVLQFLMVELGVFDEIVGEEARVEHNVAVRILNLLGVYDTWQIREIVQKYSELPRSKPGEKKKGGDMLGGTE